MATDHERSSESSLLESIARGFVYMAALNSSVGPAVDAVAGAFGAGVDPITVATPGTVVSLLIAAVLVNVDDSPRLPHIVAFGVVSLVLSLSLIAVLDGVITPPLGDVAPWLVGLGVAYGLVYIGFRSRIAKHVSPDPGGPGRGDA
jgi:hypothetical protein